ncbi:MAG: OPT family oligopeptide transporter, partial [Planctomycetota bacterium]
LAHYQSIVGTLAVSQPITLIKVVMGFNFCSVSAYMAGLVGSSNNPVSGITIATILFSAVMLLLMMGKDSAIGPVAAVMIGAVVCCAACIAGDNLQDLKCGHVVGATPWKQQLCLVIGTIASAAVIPLVLGLLDNAEGIGRAVREGTKPLSAPQASLMKELSTGIFGAGINWNFILFGCALAVVIIALDVWLERRKASFRTPILGVAVGIYLPFGLSVLIFVGGLLAWLVKRKFAPKTEHEHVQLENAGMLLASGLITGEAILSVGIAALLVAAPTWIPGGHASFGPIAALVATLGLIVYLYVRTLGAARRM